MKNYFTTKTIAGLGILSAMVVALQIFANYISFGPVSITLALIPVVVGACMYGPIGGLFLGLVDGIIIMIAPSTISLFWTCSPIGTIVTCLTKTAIAGLVAGFIFKALKDKHSKVGVVLSSVVVPIINTGLFVVYTFLFFMPVINEMAGEKNAVEFLFLTFIGVNFIIEFLVNSFLSPAVFEIYKYFDKKNK